MKKTYMKPALFAESFSLVEHVSAGCGYVTNFGNQCPIEEAGVVFFTSTPGCNDDAFILMQGKGIDPATASITDLMNAGFDCYNSFADFSMIFTSA